MALEDEYLVCTRGQNIAFAVDFGQDLTSKTFEAFEVDPSTIASGWTCTLTTPAIGLVDVTRAWGTDMPAGTGNLINLYVRSTDGAVSAYVRIWLE